MTVLPVPARGPDAANAFVAEHLDHLSGDPPAASARFRGGQPAADAALAAFDVTGYAGRRNEVLPRDRRGASALSPWIRHGLLPLPRVWQHVAGGPRRDVDKYRDELLWQEYARHWYARHGTGTRAAQRRRLRDVRHHGGWDRRLACLDAMVEELESDGWLVNQARMWLASDWTVRHRGDWREGEETFFRQLLDGSRAANRLGWQWTTGVGSAKPYGFSRWQVEKRAPDLCRSCALEASCPIRDWPDDPETDRADPPAPGPDLTGPTAAEHDRDPEAVWITAESLGDDDPALRAHPDLPVVFVFDEPLLRRLRLSGKRLVFLVETLAELACSRDLELHLGRPTELLAGRRVAVTHAPVPGFRRIAAQVRPSVVHPWPWLVRPRSGSVSSFSAWRGATGA